MMFELESSQPIPDMVVREASQSNGYRYIHTNDEQSVDAKENSEKWRERWQGEGHDFGPSPDADHWCLVISLMVIYEYYA